jgi:hypothetical protein
MKFEMSNVVKFKIIILGPEYLGSMLCRKFYIHPLVHFVCVCVCVYVCMCIRMYVLIHIRMYVCMHVCMHACMHVCMYVRMYVSMYVRMYMYVCNVCVHIRTNLCTWV